MAKKLLQVQRLRARLKDSPFGKVSKELTAPGELGRGVPSAQQAQVRSKTAKEVSEGDAVIPASKGRAELYTYFTETSGSFLLYKAEEWVRVRLLLETNGPVAVGARDDVAPPLSGKGISLPKDVEITFSLARGNRVYIAATAINRVRFIVEPIPWADQIAVMLGSLISVMKGGR
jgi:hypothetical protein